MIFSRKHFPILFLLPLIYSCNKSDLSADSQTDLFSFYDNKGDLKSNNEENDSAYYYYIKSKDACSKDEADRIIYAIGKIAGVQIKKGDFNGAEETLTSAISLFKKCKNPIYVAEINNTLGIVKEELHDYDEAINYYNKSIYESIRELDKAKIMNNIAVVHLEKKEYSKAIDLLQPLKQKTTIQKHKVTYAKILDNLGFAYFKIDNPKSLENLTESLKIRDSINDEYEKIASYIHLSHYYKNSNSNQSLEYAKKAYKSAYLVKSGDDKLEALDLVIRNTNNIDDIKTNYTVFNALNDSINQARQTAKNQFAKIRYDFKENLQKYELEKTKNYLYLALLLFFSAVASFILVTIRKRNREKIKTISYETETRIAKKIHDELANDVFNALTFAESQNLSDPNKKEALLDNLDTIYNRTRNISRENSEIQTDSQFAQQLTDLLIQYESPTVNVIINKITSINWDDVKKEVKIAIYRVLQELMVNMKKHSECSVVIVRFDNQKAHIEINYSDNGKGVKMLNSKKGLQNAENRIHAIKGTLTFDFETEKGFKASIKIPK